MTPARAAGTRFVAIMASLVGLVLLVVPLGACPAPLALDRTGGCCASDCGSGRTVAAVAAVALLVLAAALELVRHRRAAGSSGQR